MENIQGVNKMNPVLAIQQKKINVPTIGTDRTASLDPKERAHLVACHQTYKQLEAYWNKLADVFPRARDNELPICVFINPYNFPDNWPEFSCPERGLVFLPIKPNMEILLEVCEIINEQVEKHCWTPTAYSNPLNILLFSTQDIIDKGVLDQGALTEEVTHAATSLPNSQIRVTKNVIENFDGYSMGFGKELLSRLQRSYQDGFLLGINEFFVSLGQAVLSVDSSSILSEVINETISSGNPYYVDDLIYHIPQLAGLLLLQQYNGDANTVISSHPEILTLDANGIWEQFCLPLLTHGKLDK